jgi:ubiquinone/menaquinone biosynthesis C-methylase UbiE
MAGVSAVADLPPGAKVLDVGTGPGKLLTLLRQELSLDCVGVDTDPAMLSEARRRRELVGVPLLHVPPGYPLPFPPDSFDAIYFCSVLYLMTAADARALLAQASSLLSSHGRIIILTPTGADHPRLSPVWRHWTFYLWRHATAAAGRQWRSQRLAPQFAAGQAMAYTCRPVLSGLATVEALATD